MGEPLSAVLNKCAGWGPLVVRLVLGIIFIAHGSQKLFGAFGGHGMKATAEFMSSLGIAPGILWAWILALTEFAGGIALILGLCTTIASAGLVIAMLVAIIKIHAKNGFFLENHGFEYNLALIAMAVSLILSGPGKFSIDKLIRWKW